MSCKTLAALLVCLAACAGDDGVITVEISGQATHQTPLPVMTEETEPEDAEYRWEVVLAPDGSTAAAPGNMAYASFIPDLRGAYVIERWFRYGLGEELTHRFIVQVGGAAPVARASVTGSDGNVRTGNLVTLDAGASFSAEALPLSFVWRLAERPRTSIAMLATPESQTASFVPDVAGDYSIEVAVFDGELWSEPAATLDIHASTP